MMCKFRPDLWISTIFRLSEHGEHLIASWALLTRSSVKTPLFKNGNKTPSLEWKNISVGRASCSELIGQQTHRWYLPDSAASSESVILSNDDFKGKCLQAERSEAAAPLIGKITQNASPLVNLPSTPLQQSERREGGRFIPYVLPDSLILYLTEDWVIVSPICSSIMWPSWSRWRGAAYIMWELRHCGLQDPCGH